MSSSIKLFLGAFGLALTAGVYAQGPSQPLPVSVTLFPTSLGSQAAIGLQLAVYDWDMSVNLPRAAATQGLNLRPERPAEEAFRGGASVGAAWRTSLGRVGVSYRIDTSALSEPVPARSVGLSYGYEFSSGLKLSTNLDRGINDAAPRWGGGLTISYSR